MLSEIAELAKETGKSVETGIPEFARRIEPGMYADRTEAEHPVRIPTINEHLEGTAHPDTEVPFRRREIHLPERTVEGVFPEFPALHEMKLDEQLYMESDAVHFRAAGESLKKAVEADPELRAKFNDTQLAQIERGKVPEGYVWHHSEQPGVLQLVDRDLHERTRHTGGRALWGGGSDFR